MRALDLPDLSRRTILIVDDNDDSLEMLGIVLRACGAEVLQARSAVSALACIDTHPRIDVLISDISMPEMDGVDLVRRVRRHPAHATIPAIALTGFPAIVRTGFYEYYKDPTGFDAFLRKPADLDELCRTITAVIEKRQRRAAQRAG